MNIKTFFSVDYDIEILGITDDFRKVEKGYLFVATKGYYVDHYDYILEAIKRGCVFLVVDREIDFDFPHVIVENIQRIYDELCIKFYDIHLSSLHFIGITGTDGKTTVASIVKELIGDCAYIGTNGLEIKRKVFSTNNTTPAIAELCWGLEKIQKEKVSTVSMEISSEALLHHRVSSLSFDIVGFTNITGDHLNTHKTFENYVQCKLKLLELVKDGGIVIVNGDDSVLQTIQCQKMYTFGFNKNNDYVITDVKYLSNIVKITVKSKAKTYILESPLKELFNIYNVVMAFLISLFYGIDEKLLLQRIKRLHPIRGRCEYLDFGQDYLLVLDYAHTVNAIRTILDTFRDYPTIVVTGAAGGREREKRPKIGKLILEKSNISIFTMDDPRYEKVEDIITDMVGDSLKAIRIFDRKEAIYYALSIAKTGCVVLILGKGRDSYMAIGEEKVPYSDYEVIKSYFQGKG